MDCGLKDKIAVVGGSSKGLGRGCALQLAREGAQVVLCARNGEALAQTANFIRAETKAGVFPVQADLSAAGGIEKVVDQTLREFGRVDILVNNSGGPPPGTCFDFSEEEWRRAFEAVLLYVIRGIQLVVPHMKKNRWGRIINITSLTVKEPEPHMVLSNVFRSGVVSLAKSIAADLIKDNITINNICPGAFKTDRAVQLINAQAKKLQKTPEEIEKKAVLELPLGRYQDPEELGDLVVFLCSERAKGLSGTTIPVDGAVSRTLF